MTWPMEKTPIATLYFEHGTLTWETHDEGIRAMGTLREVKAATASGHQLARGIEPAWRRGKEAGLAMGHVPPSSGDAPSLADAEAPRAQ